MSAIARRTNSSGTASLTPMSANTIIGTSGEALAANDPCRINSSGLIVRSLADTAANSQIHGYAATNYAAGEPCTLYHGERHDICETAQTSGAKIYLSASVAGGFDTATSTEAPLPCGHFLEDGKRAQLYQVLR